VDVDCGVRVPSIGEDGEYLLCLKSFDFLDDPKWRMRENRLRSRFAGGGKMEVFIGIPEKPSRPGNQVAAGNEEGEKRWGAKRKGYGGYGRGPFLLA
jgi:hypothetical protein